MTKERQKKKEIGAENVLTTFHFNAMFVSNSLKAIDKLCNSKNIINTCFPP